MKKRFFVTLALTLITALTLACFIACGTTGEAKHNYSEKWETDADEHWHACTDEGCSEVSDKAAHVSDGITHYSDDKTKEYNPSARSAARK